MTLPIPDKIEEITADWLSQVLRSRNIINTDVVSAAHAPIGDDVGLLSKVVRLHVLAQNSTERFSQLVDVMAERLFASAIEIEAWEALS